MEKISIMGVRVDNKSMDEMLLTVEDKINKNQQYVIYTPNTEIIMMCQDDREFLEYMNKSDANVPDGIGLVYASKIKNKPLKGKLAGFDLSIKLLEIAQEKKLKLYIVGGKPGVADKAIENIKIKYPNIEIAGSHHGYFKGAHLGLRAHEEELKVIDEINKSKPHILFVGFGAKKQEQWIEANRQNLNANIIIGNGGTIDVLSGAVKRAPEIYVKLGLEWLYRLIKEPQRIKRQIAIPVFIARVLLGGKDIVKEI